MYEIYISKFQIIPVGVEQVLVTSPVWRTVADVVDYGPSLVAISRLRQMLLRRYPSSDNQIISFFLSRYFFLDLSLLRLPANRPVITRLSRPSALITLPKNVIWHLQTTDKSSLLPPIVSRTFKLLLHSIQLTLSKHSLSAPHLHHFQYLFNFFADSMSLVGLRQCGLNICHNGSSFCFNWRVAFFNRLFVIWTPFLLFRFFVFISVVHLASVVTMLPRYWNCSTYVMGSW